jgi:hypothetical protein
MGPSLPLPFKKATSLPASFTRRRANGQAFNYSRTLLRCKNKELKITMKRTYVFVILVCLGLLTISGCTSIMPFLTGEPRTIETKIAPR